MCWAQCKVDDMLPRLMAASGGSVGQALTLIQAEDPDLWTRWCRGVKNDTEGWQEWALEMVAEADTRRGGSSQPVRRSATGPPSFHFNDVVRLYRKEGLTLSAATRKAIDYFPDLHQRMTHGERGPIIQTPVHQKSIQRTGATSMEFRTFEQAVAAAIRSGKSRSEAIRQVVKDHPELHEEYIERTNAEHQAKQEALRGRA